MKNRECIKCKKFFECKGKVTNAPCLHFEEREKKNGNTDYRRATS